MAHKTRRSARLKNLVNAAALPLCAVALMGLGNSGAQATQSAPVTSFQGVATIDGHKVPAGTPVTAWVRGVKVVETHTFDIDGTSVYALEIGQDNEDTGIVEGARTSDLITFRVQGHPTHDTSLWHAYKSQFLDLNGDTTAEQSPITIASN